MNQPAFTDDEHERADIMAAMRAGDILVQSIPSC